MRTSPTDKAASRHFKILVHGTRIALLAGSALLFLAPRAAWAGCRGFTTLSLKPSILTQAQVRFNDGPGVECYPQILSDGGYDADFTFNVNLSHTMDCNMTPCDTSGADGFEWIGGQNSSSGTAGCTGFKAFGQGTSWTIDFKVKFHQFGTDAKKKWGTITFANMGNYYYFAIFPYSGSSTGWVCQDKARQPGVWQDITSLMQELPNP